MEIKVWILTSVLAIVVVVMGFLLKMWFRQIITRLDELVEEMKGISQVAAVQEQQIKNINDQIGESRQRLNNHSERIRNLEIKNHNQ